MPSRTTDGSRPISRREMLIGSSVAGGVALAGCLGDDGAGDDVNGDDLPGAITFLHSETADERRAVFNDPLGVEYEEETGVEMNQRVIQEADYAQEITTAVASDTLPDVGSISNDVVLAARDAIDPATELVEEIGEDRFYDKVLDLTRLPDGSYSGVPLRAWPQLTIARRSAFDEIGMDAPQTWNDWLDAAEEFHDPDNNEYGCLVGTAVDQYTRQCFAGFALSNNARVFDEDGNIIFDSDEMIEALEVYGELAQYTPPGDTDSSTIGEVYDAGNAQLYSGNAYSLYFNSLGLEEGEMLGEYHEPAIQEERAATYGQVEVLSTFTDKTEGERQAAEDWIRLLMGEFDISHHIQYLHMQVGGFQPVLPEIPEMEEYRDNDILSHWPDELIEETLPEAQQSIEQFGFRDGTVFPEIGPIVGNFDIAQAVSDVIDGEDPRTVAEEAADRMRDRID